MPWSVKRELHQQLRDGTPGTEILTWLNAQPEAAAVLSRLFHGAAVTPQNLSDYRSSTEFTKWMQSQQRLEEAQEKTRFVLGLSSDAGLDLSDAADAVTTSKILELMETAETDDVVALTEVFARLRKASVERAAQSLREREMANRIARLELDREKFEKATVEKFLAFAKTKEAQEILSSGKPKRVQMDLLHTLMFGHKPETPPPAEG